MVAGRIAGQAGEDLGFARQAAKGARMQDAGAVAGKGSAIGMGRLWMYYGQRERPCHRRRCFQAADHSVLLMKSSRVGLGLVIPQQSVRVHGNSEWERQSGNVSEGETATDVSRVTNADCAPVL